MTEQILFGLFALVTCGGAIAVVISQNVVRMAFWLIISLGSTAGLFFLLHADFVGATQLLVYVGGTLVLLIFGVMLTASGPLLQISSSPGSLFASALVGTLLLAMILSTVGAVDWEATATRVNGEIFIPSIEGFNEKNEGNTGRALGLSFLGLRPDKDLGSVGGQVSVGYLLPFEIVSVHLLVVLIGAAYLARAKRRVETSTD